MEMLTNYLDSRRADVSVLIVTNAKVLYRCKVISKCEKYNPKPINQYQQFQIIKTKVTLIRYL